MLLVIYVKRERTCVIFSGARTARNVFCANIRGEGVLRGFGRMCVWNAQDLVCIFCVFRFRESVRSNKRAQCSKSRQLFGKA